MVPSAELTNYSWRMRLCVLISLAFAWSPLNGAWVGQNGIDWQPWSESVFIQAKKEGRFVLLDLGTVWCHWCHVMDEITYEDPKVIQLIGSHYTVSQKSLPKRGSAGGERQPGVGQGQVSFHHAGRLDTFRSPRDRRPGQAPLP
jgi:hypothetical protein